MVTLPVVPDGWDDCVACYGDPLYPSGIANPNYQHTHLAVFTSPFPLRQSWDDMIIGKFWAHRLVGAVIVDALQEVLDVYTREGIEEYDLDEWGGCWNPRRKRGSQDWSLHTMAIAVDYLPSRGRLGEAPMTPAIVVEAFEKRGFLWLGRAARRDAMHLQAAGPSY